MVPRTDRSRWATPAVLSKANLERQKLGKEILALDENFLSALEQGLPDSCGVAVGFDRLLMLQLNKIH